MKVLLCGWGQAGTVVLWYLSKRYGISDLAVCTHEELPWDRSLAPVAEALGIWYTYDGVNDAELPFKPDIIVSAWYRTIIKQHVIDMVGGRIMNVHPSLLPKHRGCSSITWALIEGDNYTGVTFHYIQRGIDTGPILAQIPLRITSRDTQQTLFEGVVDIISNNIDYAFGRLVDGVPGFDQRGKASYHKRETPYGGKINPDWPTATIERFIRAMTRPPLPYATINGVPVMTLDQYDEVVNGG